MSTSRKPLEVVHVVFGGGIALAAYRAEAADSAELHARCITGAVVASVELLSRVPPEIIRDLEAEVFAEIDDDTPLQVEALTYEDLVDSGEEK
jgi:hypothetical protein